MVPAGIYFQSHSRRVWKDTLDQGIDFVLWDKVNLGHGERR